MDEKTIYDILRAIADSALVGDFHREVTKWINKLDPDVEDAPEPEVPVDPKDAEIAALQAQLAAQGSQGSTAPPAM